MPVVKLDSDESVFFARELEHIKSKTYDVKYAAIKHRSLIPTSFDVDRGAQSITYHQYDHVGMAKIISNYARDFPRADVKKKEFTTPVKGLGSSYGYSIQDIRSAALAGVPLEQRRANAAKRSIAEREQRIGYFGIPEFNVPGFLNHPNISEVALLNDGTGGDTTFASKINEPDKIIRDMNSLANYIFSISKGVEMANTSIMPLDQYSRLKSTPRSQTSETTIMEYYLANNISVTDVDFLAQLTADNSGDALDDDTMITYFRDKDAIVLEIPQDFEQFPAQEEGMDFTVYCHSRCGGTVLYYPLSAARTSDL